MATIQPYINKYATAAGNYLANTGSNILGGYVSGMVGDVTGNQQVDSAIKSQVGNAASHYANQGIRYLASGGNSGFTNYNPSLTGTISALVGGAAGSAIGRRAGNWASRYGAPTGYAVGGATGHAAGAAAGGAAAGAYGALTGATTAGLGAGMASGALAGLTNPIGWILYGAKTAHDKVKAGVVDWEDYAKGTAPLETHRNAPAFGLSTDRINEMAPGQGYMYEGSLGLTSFDPREQLQGVKNVGYAVRDLISGGSYGEGERDRAQQKQDVYGLASQGYRMRDSNFDRYLDPMYDVSDRQLANRMANPMATAQQMMRLGVQPTAGDPTWALWKNMTRGVKGRDYDKTIQNLAGRMDDTSLIQRSLPYATHPRQRKVLQDILRVGTPDWEARNTSISGFLPSASGPMQMPSQEMV